MTLSDLRIVANRRFDAFPLFMPLLDPSSRIGCGAGKGL